MSMSCGVEKLTDISGAIETDTAHGVGTYGTRVAGWRARLLRHRLILPVTVWLLLSFVWGTTWLFLKLGLRDLPPLSFAALRLLVAGAILSVIVAARRAALPRDPRDWGLMAATGMLVFTINYALTFWGVQHISAGLAALLSSTVPMLGLLIAHFHLPGEPLTLRSVCGVLIGVAGVALIFSGQLSAKGPFAMWGCAAVLVSSLCLAYAHVLVKSRGAHLDRWVLSAAQMCIAFVPLLALGMLIEGNPLRFRWSSLALVSLAYLVLVGSILGTFMFYWLVKNIAVTKAMLIFLVTPVVAVALGMLILGESLTWRVAMGGACVLGGVGMIMIRGLRARRELIARSK